MLRHMGKNGPNPIYTICLKTLLQRHS